jgi:hypothetical protein
MFDAFGILFGNRFGNANGDQKIADNTVPVTRLISEMLAVFG